MHYSFWELEEIIAATAEMLYKKVVVHMEQERTITFQPDKGAEGMKDTNY